MNWKNAQLEIPAHGHTRIKKEKTGAKQGAKAVGIMIIIAVLVGTALALI